MPQHQEETERLLPTGLRKICPRCKRIGTVFLNPEDNFFTILWEGPPRGGHGGECDRDILVHLTTLINPNAGCGYDISMGVDVEDS